MTEITTDPKGQSDTNQNNQIDPPQGDKSTQTQLPKQFEGKSAEDIAKSYVELQKKLGEQSAEVGKTRAEIQQAKETLGKWEALAKVIQGNPALYNSIEAEIQKVSGKSTAIQKDPGVAKIEKDVADTRLATQGAIFEKFEDKFGISRMEEGEKKELQGRIGKELHDMLDPRNSKDLNAVIAEIPLDSLQLYLEKAYKLATVDDSKERARVEGMVRARKNNEAAFGNIPSGGVRGNSQELTPEQLKVAQKLGVKPEKYLKNLQEYQ